MTWNIHIYEFLRRPLRDYIFGTTRAKVTRTGLGLYYFSCIRSFMDHAIPAFYSSLPKYLIQKWERNTQKTAMSIICHGII